MLGKNRWAMLLTAALLLGATAAVPAAGAQTSNPRSPTEANECADELEVTCHQGNSFCPVYTSDAGCMGEHPITPCHSRVEIACEEPGGHVCILWAEAQVLDDTVGGCLVG